jgi:pyruvate/2-oxoglutarate dehydrogenase complex dihydrolipoamide dehydrogenase (E3) component
VAIGAQGFSGVAKARAIGEARGFIRLVVEASTDRILGCHVVGPDTGNLVHEAVIAMLAGASYSESGVPSTSTRPSPRGSTPRPVVSANPPGQTERSCPGPGRPGRDP